jgi:hypothetical protein
VQPQQQEQTTPQIIEEKIAQLQQQSVLKAIAPNLVTEQRDPITSFNQLNKQPLQANNNGDSTRNDVNSESVQPQQQEQTTPQIIEEKIAQLQQQSVLKAIAPNLVTEQEQEQEKAPSLDKLNNIISSIPVPSP